MGIIRFFFKLIFLVILSVVCIFIYARYVEPNMISVKNIDIGNEECLNSVKVVIFSDTHYGKLYSENKSENITKVINEQNADMVIFGGDLIDEYASDLPDLDIIIKGLKGIKSKYGKYAVWGNHDYGGGASRIYEDVLYEGDFRLLRNETTLIDELNINLLATDDFLLGQPDIEIGEGAVKGAYNILISHAPDIADELDLNNVDIMLSGHSHGGQVKIPYITKMVLPPGGNKYVDGMYNIDNSGKTKIYVTTGVGLTKIPLRFLNTPEVVVLNIRY